MNKTVTQYRFGDTVFRVETHAPMRKDPRFEAFSVPEEVPPTYILSTHTMTMEMAENTSWPAVTRREGNHIRVYMNTELIPSITVANLLVISHADHLLPEQGAFILHASYVLHNGEAILFCAPKQTGKSTQAGYWERERGAVVVNEDRALIFSREGRFYAGGIWATGSAGITKPVTAPIRAVILLGQGTENRVFEERPSQRIVKLLPQCSYDETSPAAYGRMVGLVMDLLGSVRVLSYDCVNHPSAVADLEAYL
jgi:hypothetical protein